ncbi:MAG: 3-phosphoshikimate 1-carboxyvinyltransferase [Verrucomicrobiia bacterium]
MPLPELIEVKSLIRPVEARVVVPGSKSVTNRALILSTFAKGEVTLIGALWSDDTIVLVECLKKLGYEIVVSEDKVERCNRTIKVKGKGGIVPPGGTKDSPLELFVGNAGTAARFLAAMVAMGEGGVYRLYGTERMNERPQSGLFNALRQLGYRIESQNDRLPALIYGGKKRSGRCEVDISDSSQFASALLMCAKVAGWEVSIKGSSAEESPYVRMTEEMIATFPYNGGEFAVEADASSGSYFIAAGVLKKSEGLGDMYFSIHNYERYKIRENRPEYPLDLSVRVVNWPTSGWQIDQSFEFIYRDFAGFIIGGGDVTEKDMIGWLGEEWRKHEKILNQSPIIYSRKTDLGDSIMTLIVLAPLATLPIWFIDLEQLRLQECERVKALKTELEKCGAIVTEEGNSLKFLPARLHGAEIETYDDHRMAMAFTILGLKVPGIKIRNPNCVKKTFPTFYQKLALPPPAGLGATILNAETGEEIEYEDLYAD